MITLFTAFVLIYSIYFAVAWRSKRLTRFFEHDRITLCLFPLFAFFEGIVIGMLCSLLTP